MSTKTIANAVITKLRQGQEQVADKLKQKLENVHNSPDRIQVQYATSVFANNPLETDWKVLLENIESLLMTDDQDQLEIVFQDVLETLSHLIGNDVLDSKFVTPYIGSRSRKYIEEYDNFMGSKTPGF